MSYPVTQRIREERKVQAVKRQEEYSKLTVQEKLSRLPEGGSNKQRTRLLKERTGPL